MRRYLPTVLLTCALALPGGAARAQEAPDAEATPEAATNAECVRGYEEGQVARQAGQLVSSRSLLQLCARDECPDFIRSDCATWYGEVQTEVPTVVFAARSRGLDLVDVRVSLGGRDLAARIDGQALELDPGEYDFTFHAPGMQPRTQHSLIVRGERNRLIQVELVPEGGSPAALSTEADAPSLAARQRSLLLPGIFAGIGVAGLSGFALLAASGRSTESLLEDACAPRCSERQVSGVRTKYLIADVSLGVGVASLALGAYFLFSQPSGATAQTPPVNLQASAEGASFVYGGRF